MIYLVKFKPRAEKELNKIPSPYYERIVKCISSLRTSPFIGKKLEGKFKEYYVVRVWPYRIIYSIYKNELFIFIVSVSHRQGSYKH